VWVASSYSQALAGANFTAGGAEAAAAAERT
jgi:hypothetical protein